MRSWVVAVLLLVAGSAWAGRAVVDWEPRHVNVRAAPDEGAPRLGRLGKGASVTTLGRQGEWTRVRFEGGEGWVVTRSLRILPEPGPAPSAAPKPAAPAPDPAARTPELPLPPPVVVAPAPLPSSTSPTGGYLAQYAEAPAPPAVEAGSSLLRLVSGLLLVLALLAGAVYLARRFLGRGFSLDRKGSAIRILASRAVGPRQGLLLVEAGGLVWLLAQAADGVTLLAEIRDEAALERLNERYGFRDTPFEAELRRTMDLEGEGSLRGPTPDRVPDSSGSSPEPTAEERLAALRRRAKPGGPP